MRVSPGEVIRESINNAIFHGGASEVTIRVDHLSDDVLHLVVKDNGKGPDGEMNFGLGSKLMDTVTLNWSLRKDSHHTVLEAHFAIDSVPATPSL